MLKSHRKELIIQRQEIDSSRQEIDSNQKMMDSNQQELNNLQQEIERSRRSRLIWHVVNLLVKTTEKVLAIRGIDTPHVDDDDEIGPTYDQYAQAVRLIKRDNWESDTNLPIKYWKIMQHLPKVSHPLPQLKFFFFF